VIQINKDHGVFGFGIAYSRNHGISDPGVLPHSSRCVFNISEHLTADTMQTGNHGLELCGMLTFLLPQSVDEIGYISTESVES
jgi:hypothetical protein